MGLIRHYLRVFIRSHFRPINPAVAHKWEINTSVMYFVAAWTTLGVSIYYFKKGLEKDSDNYSSGQLYTVYDCARKFGGEKATILHVKGFNNIEKEVLTHEELQNK